MTPYHINQLREWIASGLAPRNTKLPSKWCVESLVFDETDNHGPFRTAGCEYVVAPLDDFASTNITDEVLVWGSQTKKTGTLMGGAAFCAVNDPCGFLWVMPNIDLARKFSRQRWLPLLRASGPTRDLIPEGADRHDFASATQILGAASFNFVGSNSAANLASQPCRRVILDEVDKFDRGGRREADAVDLAEQRTKNMTYPQRWKTSTPTLENGLIWQQARRGILYRYFGPCVHCHQLVVPAWSRKYTTFPVQGYEAFVEWDPSAKRDNGSWDMAKVERTAHLVCPFCQGHLLESMKTVMCRNGKWLPTLRSIISTSGRPTWVPVEPGDTSTFVVRHLPSMWASSPQTTFGRLAVKFLSAKNSLQGAQGFINGELAEPYRSQDRVEITTTVARGITVEVTNEWTKLLTIDPQQRAPHFWWVLRAWAHLRCHGIESGSFNSWQDIEQFQMRHGIANECVALDTRWNTHEVVRRCALHSDIIEPDGGQGTALYLGWLPVGGTPKREWKNESGAIVPWRFAPIDANPNNGLRNLASMNRLDFVSDYFKDLMHAMRAGEGGWQWTISDSANTEDYQHHNAAEVRNETTGHWEKRVKDWPDHLRDCEMIQCAVAASLGLITE